MKARLLASILAVVLCLALLAGCWDRLEIEDRAAVIEVGLDPGPSGQGVHLTAQIAIPGKIPLGPGGGGGTGGGGSTNPRETVYVDAADGPTVEAALNSLQDTLNDELFLGHLRVIVVNEQLARAGLSSVIDYFHRSSETRRTSWLLVSSDSAADVLNARPAFSRVPGLFFTDMMEHDVNMGLLPPLFLGTYLVTSADKGTEPLLPYIWAQGQGARLLGAAVFQGQRMVGTLNMADLQYVEDVIGPKKGAQIVEVPVPGSPGSSVRMKIIGRQAQVQPSVVGGRPHVDVRLRLEANILEEVGARKLEHSEELDAISAAAVKSVQQNLHRVLAVTQAEHADVFGFGEQFRGKQPKFFKQEVKTRDVWADKYYPQLDVSFQVKVLIRRIGMENR